MAVLVLMIVLSVSLVTMHREPGPDAGVVLDGATVDLAAAHDKPQRGNRPTTTTTAPSTTTTAAPSTTTTAAPTTTTTAPSTTTTAAPSTTTTTAPSEPEPEPGPVRYLSTTGSNADDGLSEQTPWATFEYALPRLTCGTTLVVAGDHSTPYVPAGTVPMLTYAATTAQRTCTQDTGIRIVAAPDAEPVIKGLVRLNLLRYWTLDDIDVTWHSGAYTDHMVKVNGGVGWTWQNSELWGADSFANLLVAPAWTGELPSYWTVAGNCIHDNVASRDPDATNNRSHLLYVGSIGGSTGGRITRNVLFNAVAGQGIKLDDGSLENSPTGVLVDRNTVHNIAFHPILVSDDAADNRIERNLLVDGTTSSGAAGAVRAYALTQPSNEMSDNAYWRTSRTNDQPVLNYPAGYGFTGSGNVGIDPQFDAVGSCSGYRPTNPAAVGYGAHAP